jgi:hypothetical protein
MYMAAEMYEEEPHKAAVDVHSLSLILDELVVGNRVFLRDCLPSGS